MKTKLSEMSQEWQVSETSKLAIFSVLYQNNFLDDLQDH